MSVYVCVCVCVYVCSEKWLSQFDDLWDREVPIKSRLSPDWLIWVMTGEENQLFFP